MTDDVDLVPGGATTRPLALSLLGGFELRAGGAVEPLPIGSQRLLALLALRDRPLTRPMIAGSLWPGSSDLHASASLRSALTRLRGDARRAVDIADIDIALAPDVVVDVRVAKRLAHRLLEPEPPLVDDDVAAAAVGAFSCTLLPGWDDEWIRGDVSEWHQLRLHALEALADQLAARGRWAEAIDAAQAAIRGEPLRETSHAALIRVFLAGGNEREALVHFERYRMLLREELRLDPTPHIADLVETIPADDDTGRARDAAANRSAPPRGRDAPRRGSG